MMTVLAPPYHVRRRRTDLAHRHHVEEDVQRAAMQPPGTQDRPPHMGAKYRPRPTQTEAQRRELPRTKNRERAAAEDALAVHQRQEQAEGVERRASVDDDGDEPEIMSEPAQHRSEPPETWIAATACVALLVVDADEGTARRAHH